MQTMKFRSSLFIALFTFSGLFAAGCSDAGSPEVSGNNGTANNGTTNNGTTNNGTTNNGTTNNGTTNNGECVPTGDELCDDGIDNDCDGEIDEGFEDLGSECTAGLGVCETSGTFVCSSDLTSLECDAMPDQPGEADEMTCDGLDNDCDGEVDEGCDNDEDGYCDSEMTVDGTPDVCPNGGGDCNDESDAAYPGAPGVCSDGIDNDCDGEIDNFVGIDRTDPTYGLSGAGASSNSDTSPSVMATSTDDGFCVAVHDSGTGDIGIGLIDVANDSIDFKIRSLATDSTLRLHDIAWDGTSCGVVYTSFDDSMSNQRQDVYILRYEPGTSSVQRLEVANEGATGTQDKYAALTSDGTDWLVAYGVQGDATYYRTVPAGFTFSSSASAEIDLGNLGLGYEFGPSPNPADDFLFVSSFINVGVYSVNAGSAGSRVADLQFSSPKLNQWVEQVGDSVYRFGASGGDTEVVEFLASYQLGNTGEVSYAASTDQEEIARDVATGGPQDSKWYIDPYGDVAYTFADDGSEITFELQSHPNLNGELLAVATVGDEVVVLALTEAGTSGSMTQPATVTVFNYTCS